MVYAKCKRVNKEKETLDLIDNNGNEFEVPYIELDSAIKNREIEVINIVKELPNYRIVPFGIEGYHKLSSDSISQKTENIYSKSIVLNIDPLIERANSDTKVCKKSKYDKLYITDCTRYISGNIQAKEIVFIGDQSLINYYWIKSDESVIIKCNKAVIANGAIMSCLIHRDHTPVKLEAKEIELRHKYIDENTIFELEYLLDCFDSSINASDRLHFIHVHFESVNIDYDVLLNNIKELNNKTDRYISRVAYSMRIIYDMKHERKNKDTLYKLFIYLENHMILMESLKISLPKYVSVLSQESDKTIERMNKLLNEFKQYNTAETMNIFNDALYIHNLYSYNKFS